MSETLVDFVEALTAATENAVARLSLEEPGLASVYEDVMLAAGTRAAANLRSKGQALAAAAFVPPDEDEVAETDQTKAEMREKATGAIEEAADTVGEAFAEEGIDFDVDAIFTPDLIEAIGERAAFSADELVRDSYREVIVDAAENGWSVDDTAEVLSEKIADLSPGRAAALARTDLNGMANGASVHIASVTKDPDETVYKTWLATDDERTRDSHVEADGQSVLVNEVFQVGGAQLNYPGDPFGPHEEVMNCRCTVIYGSSPGSAVVSPALALPTHALAMALPTSELRELESGERVPAVTLNITPPPASFEQQQLLSALAMRATDLTALATAIEALALAQAAPPPAPVVHVHVPEQLAPIVNVPLADSPTVQVDVHVPEAEPPVVNVEVPTQPVALTVDVELPLPRRIEFERDGNGKLTAAEEVE